MDCVRYMHAFLKHVGVVHDEFWVFFLVFMEERTQPIFVSQDRL